MEVIFIFKYRLVVSVNWFFEKKFQYKSHFKNAIILTNISELEMATKRQRNCT